MPLRKQSSNENQRKVSVTKQDIRETETLFRDFNVDIDKSAFPRFTNKGSLFTWRKRMIDKRLDA